MRGEFSESTRVGKTRSHKGHTARALAKAARHAFKGCLDSVRERLGLQFRAESQQPSVSEHLELELVEVLLSGGEKQLERGCLGAIHAQDDVAELDAGLCGAAIRENFPNGYAAQQLR